MKGHDVATRMKQMIWEQLDKQRAEARKILDLAQSENRELTADETKTFDEVMEKVASAEGQLRLSDKFDEQVRSAESGMLGGVARTESRADQWIDTDSGQPVALRSGQKFGEHEVVKAHAERAANAEAAALTQYGGLAEMIRALATTGGGSAVIPTVWSANLIDRARNASALMQAGATIVPMGAKTVNIGRLTGDPVPTFRAEASAINISDPVFDSLTLEAKTQSAEVVVSMEWLQDNEGGGELVLNALAKAVGQKLDQVALYGGVTTGHGPGINLPVPPNPRGIVSALNATLPAHVLGSGAANGTDVTSYTALLDLVYTVRHANENSTAIVTNTHLSRQFAGLVDTTNQPLRLPVALEALPQYTSNTIPRYTTGTTTNRTTDAFAADWPQLIIGQRLEPTIQVLNELKAETGQVAIIIHWRGDVGLARPAAFAVYKSLYGAL